MKGLRFEPLRDEHFPAVLEIEAKCNAAPWSEQSFRAELTNKQSVFLVALCGKDVVGYGGIWKVVDEAHVTTLAVSPDFRRQGIGKKIMEELLGRAATDGLRCSTLEVRASNKAAIDLYKTMGFLETAKRRGYYSNNREDAVVMWLHGLDAFAPSARMR